MPFTLFILFPNLLWVVFGRFTGRNEANDYEKNWMKKLKENIFPTEALYRSPELEYIRYRNEQNVKSRNYDMLRRMIPGILLGNLIKPLALMVTDPDKQTIDLPMTIWDKNKNDDNQGTELVYEKSVVSPTTKSMIQLSEKGATTKNDLLNSGELKKDPELNTEQVLQPNMSGTFEELNITEVYEEPFIRIYVKPLCEGPDC